MAPSLSLSPFERAMTWSARVRLATFFAEALCWPPLPERMSLRISRPFEMR
jgi:hypothetical protein